MIQNYNYAKSPKVLCRSDLEQRPYMLVKRYLGGEMTLIESAEGLKPDTGADKIKDHSHVVYLMVGTPRAYGLSLGGKPETVKYGMTDVYALEFEKQAK